MKPEARKVTYFCLFRRLILFGGLWILLTGATADGVLMGVFVVPLCVWLSTALLPPVRPLVFRRLLRIAPGFLWRSVVGGVDVARRAFHPRLPLEPGWVSVPVRVSAGTRVALGSELSLMPGTLVAGSDGDELLIHLLDVKQGVSDQVQQEAERFRLLWEDA